MSRLPFYKQVELVATDKEISNMLDIPVVKSTWYFKLPIIRHLRAMRLLREINRHYDFYTKMGAIPWGIKDDYKVARAIWDGRI